MESGLLNGGGGGIRTHGTLARTTVFKTAPINRSGTPPKIFIGYLLIIYKKKSVVKGVREINFFIFIFASIQYLILINITLQSILKFFSIQVSQMRSTIQANKVFSCKCFEFF